VSPRRIGRAMSMLDGDKPRRSLADAKRDQDIAAGGREARSIKIANGKVARASIDLKRLGGRSELGNVYWAYLRYSFRSLTWTKYVGRVEDDTRMGRLRQAWALARKRGLLRHRK